jgi:hypothetical protein
MENDKQQFFLNDKSNMNPKIQKYMSTCCDFVQNVLETQVG